MATMLAKTALVFSLAVRVYDGYGVPDQELAVAKATAQHIFAGAGVAIQWKSCPCESRVGPAELVIRIGAAPSTSVPASLGFSYVDVSQRGGTLATVFADRVKALAAGPRVDEGQLLGRAMAHELGHLLIGTLDHNRAGLMRGLWTTIDLQNDRPWDWTFSHGESARMRQAIVRRTREPARPAAVVASTPGEEILAP
jgi:hypothetical protein